MGHNSVVFLGAELTVRPGWESFVVAPSAPKNYKDPAKIDEYVKKSWADLETNAAAHPLTGCVTRVAICSDNQQIEMSAVDGYQKLTELILLAGDRTRLCIVGFSVRPLVRLLAIQAALQGAPAWGLQPVSDPRRAVSSFDLLDPMERLALGANDEQIIALLRFISSQKGGVDLSVVGESGLKHAMQRAQCAKTVFDAFNMVSLCQ